MELGLIVDDRKVSTDMPYELKLTPKGHEVAVALQPLYKTLDLSFKEKEDDIPSWEMNAQPSVFNVALSEFIQRNPKEGEFISSVFLGMHAVNLMLNYLYRIERKSVVTKNSLFMTICKKKQMNFKAISLVKVLSR